MGSRFVRAALLRQKHDEKEGNKVPRRKMVLTRSLTKDVATPTRTMNRKNHQYSDRDARPLKSAYLERQTRTDS